MESTPSDLALLSAGFFSRGGRHMAAGKWWRCLRCGELNPPLIKYCTMARCRAKNPNIEDEPKKVEPAKPKTPRAPKPVWVIKLSVWLSVLTPLIFGATFFLPPPWNAIIKAVFELIKQIINM